jgi:hypothetical protein
MRLTRGNRMKKRTHVALGLVAAVLTVAAPAWASFPGENGRIVFSSNRVFPPEIYSMNRRDRASPPDLEHRPGSGAACLA